MRDQKLIFNVPWLKFRRQDLRAKSTLSENILWNRLRNGRLGVKFFRQYSVEGYVVDFYCPEKRLAIEIEGSIHTLRNQITYDKYRKRYVNSYNISFIVFSNQDIFTRSTLVEKAILDCLRTLS